jgi:hypothetical protein
MRLGLSLEKLVDDETGLNGLSKADLVGDQHS